MKLSQSFHLRLGERVSEDHKEKQNKPESQSSPLICILSVLPQCKEHYLLHMVNL